MVKSNAYQTELLSKMHLRLWLKSLKTSNLTEGRSRRKLRGDHKCTFSRFNMTFSLYFARLKTGAIFNLLRTSNSNAIGTVARRTKERLAVRIAVPENCLASLVQLTAKETA